uniref:Uncharacterized protein n=1 Tax=Arundo donax TaxID=35708 RepID=A0A0A8Z3Y1_ARUDO
MSMRVEAMHHSAAGMRKQQRLSSHNDRCPLLNP